MMTASSKYSPVEIMRSSMGLFYSERISKELFYFLVSFYLIGNKFPGGYFSFGSQLTIFIISRFSIPTVKTEKVWALFNLLEKCHAYKTSFWSVRTQTRVRGAISGL